jgi:hypothetical protein
MKFSIHGTICGQTLNLQNLADVLGALPGVYVHGFETSTGEYSLTDDFTINDLAIDAATKDALKDAGLIRVGDIKKRSIRSLSYIHHIGKKRLDVLLKELERLGVFLDER